MARKKESDKKKLLAILCDMPIVSIACRQIGLSRATYYRWCDSDREFANTIDRVISKGEDAITDLAVSKLIARINQGDIWALQFWLRNRSSRFGFPKVTPPPEEIKYKEVTIIPFPPRNNNNKR